MKKTEILDSVRNELMAQGLGAQFDETTSQTNLLTLLKTHEGDKRYFKPLASYDVFKWLPFHYENSISGEPLASVRDEQKIISSLSPLS